MFQHADFIAWMILYPLAVTIIAAIEHQFGPKIECSENVKFSVALVQFCIWVGVGNALF
jgi:hypothetical protein